MSTIPTTTTGLASLNGPSLGIDYSLPGKHLPIQERRAKEIAVLRDKHAKTRLDEYSTRVTKKTAAARRRAMDEWADFFERTAHIDHKQIWYGLCLDDAHAVRHCQTFLEDYVLNTKQRLVITGEHMETEDVRSITSAKSMCLLWDSLVGHANSTILQEKRDADPLNRSLWVLSNSNKQRVAGYAGPVSRIRKWIQETLAPDVGLTLHQTFQKREATVDDVLLVIRTLWERSRDISCDQRLRVAFHSTLLVAAVGGFRPGVIENITYGNVELAIVRGPSGPVLVGTFHLTQNKRKEGRISFGQDEFISFSVAFVPEKKVCLLSLIVAQALADQAFDPEFRSLEELLTRPKLEDGIDYIHLPWKAKMQEERIFPIDYARYALIWRRTWFVSGAREKVRPYATRVGAGARIDASASNSIRNYVLSNTNRVFERSYIPRHLRIDLLKTNFAARGMAENCDQIFELLRRASLKSDPNAPLYPTRDDIQLMESGQALRDLRAAHAKLRESAAADSPEVKRAAARIQAHIRRAKTKIVETRRKEYFEKVDRLRALGRSAVELKPQSEEVIPESKWCLLVASTAIGEFLERPELGGERRQHYWVELLCAHLTLRPASVEGLVKALSAGGESGSGDATVHIAQPEPYIWGNPTRCLLGCEQTFEHRSSLTKHFMHCHGVTFGLLFECPECWRLGIRPAAVIGSVLEWSAHVETHHGKGFAPIMDVDRATQISAHKARKHLPKDLARCLICNAQFCRGAGFSRHLRNRHVGKDLAEPLPCPECHRQGGSDVIWINGLEDWLHHARVVHSFDSETGANLSEDGTAQELLNIPKESRAKHGWGKASRRPLTSSEQADRLESRRAKNRNYKKRRQAKEKAARAAGSQSGSASDARESSAPPARRRSRRIVASVKAQEDPDETSEYSDESVEDKDDVFNPIDLAAESDSDTLSDCEVISNPDDLSESIPLDGDCMAESSDLDASQLSDIDQSVAFESIDLDLDFASTFDIDNAVDENPDHIDPTLQMPSRLEVVLPPVADTNLYQIFDEDLVQYDSVGMASDAQPCDVIPSMFPMDLDYEKLSDQALSDQVSGYATDDRRNDAAPIVTFDIPEDVQPFTAPHKSQRNEQLDMYIPAYFSLRDL